uniref:Uncharacterized protein n=1 Tax=Tanacetum cinerariifolium TaxID=118510 RepID=A0A6L2KVN0_TANCI|nr:hypothetical protein [Tanacetum cinerariifolium]
MTPEEEASYPWEQHSGGDIDICRAFLKLCIVEDPIWEKITHELEEPIRSTHVDDQEHFEGNALDPWISALEQGRATILGEHEQWLLALGWHLEKLHVTWAHLEKKWTRPHLYTKYLEELRRHAYKAWRRHRQYKARAADAEYRGVTNAVAETCWLRNLLRELHTPLTSATLVYCDNYADIFTGLRSALFEEFRTSLSIRKMLNGTKKRMSPHFVGHPLARENVVPLVHIYLTKSRKDKKTNGARMAPPLEWALPPSIESSNSLSEILSPPRTKKIELRGSPMTH